jgi:hypothetical protein
MMDVVLRNLVGTDCWNFMDDVIVFSQFAEEHAQRLDNVLRKFDENNLHLHSGKCVFAQPKLQYLGYVLSNKGVSSSTPPQKMPRTLGRFWTGILFPEVCAGF